jgi:uncharacterized protein
LAVATGSRPGQIFSQLFNWKIEEIGPAAMIRTGGEFWRTHHRFSGMSRTNYTIFYVKVDDVKAYLEKAASLGGKMVVPPVAIPGGTFAWFADPEGNTIGLFGDQK